VPLSPLREVGDYKRRDGPSGKLCDRPGYPRIPELEGALGPYLQGHGGRVCNGAESGKGTFRGRDGGTCGGILRQEKDHRGILPLSVRIYCEKQDPGETEKAGGDLQKTGREGDGKGIRPDLRDRHGTSGQNGGDTGR